MSGFLVFLGIWGALNLTATYLIKKEDEFEHRKFIKIVGVWLVPYVLSFMTILNAIGKTRKEKFENIPIGELPPGFVLEEAVDEIGVGASEKFSVKSNLSMVNGFPLLDWDAFENFLEKLESEELRRKAMVDAKKAWLIHLREMLGKKYSLFEQNGVFVLSPLEPRVAMATANFIVTARQRISSILSEEIAQWDSEETIIFVVLHDEDTYYNYVGCYYPDEGEFSFSSGMFIKKGVGHFVATANQLTKMEPIIAHELTHCALAYLHLPNWIDEGLAVNTERLVIDGTKYMLYSINELRNMHASFWEERRIQQFWSGESFFRPDEGNLLSYELARVLIEQMNKNWPAFVKFVRQAKIEDSGLQAAKDCLGIDLGHYVCALLEKPISDQWRPDPSQWVSI